MRIIATVNGEKVAFGAEPHEMLLDVLRREGYKGVKRGCNTGDCGACAIILDGVVVNSCIVFAASVQGKEIITIEGIGTPDDPHPLQTAFDEEGAIQCGFCTPASIITAYALLKRNPDPTEEEIRDALSGNLCRCGTYSKQINAIQRVAKQGGD